MVLLKYRNKLKKINIDRYSTLEEFLYLIQSLFTTKGKIIGFQDSADGPFYDAQSFMRQLHLFQTKTMTVITDESSNSRLQWKKKKIVKKVHKDHACRSPSHYSWTQKVFEQFLKLIYQKKQQRQEMQMSFKYSQISEGAVGFIDFIYDLEEFQNILGGESYTVIVLLDEFDPSHLDFLNQLEHLISNYNRWIPFYYTYHNRLKATDNLGQKKLAWIYRGPKKIVQIHMSNAAKIRQLDEIIQKLVNARNSSNGFTDHQQQQQPRRSKSIRKLVDEFEHRNASRHMSPTLPHSQLVTTRIQFVHRQQQEQQQEEEARPSAFQQEEQLLNLQDQLLQLATDLELKQILDMSAARMVKRLILEENREIIMVLDGYLHNMYNVTVLWQLY